MRFIDLRQKRTIRNQRRSQKLILCSVQILYKYCTNMHKYCVQYKAGLCIFCEIEAHRVLYNNTETFRQNKAIRPRSIEHLEHEHLLK